MEPAARPMGDFRGVGSWFGLPGSRSDAGLWTPSGTLWSNRRVAPTVDPEAHEAQPSRGQLAKALEREERIAAALRDVGSALGTLHDLDELLQLVLSHLRGLVEAERAVLFLLDERNQVLEARVSVPPTDAYPTVPVGEGLVGRVVRSGRLLRLDGPHDRRFDPRWDVVGQEVIQSALAAPLKNNLGRTIGVVQVVNRRAGGFNEDDEEILTTLSTQAAVAIDNSRLLLSLIDKNRQLSATKDQLERRVRDLELLFELERSTAQAASHEELARAVLGKLARACDARAAGLLLRDEETRELIEYTLDVEAPGLRARGPINEGILWRVLTGNAPLEHDAQDGEVEREAAFPFAIETFIAQPLDGDGQALGALALFNKDGSAFSKEDFELLRLVCANLATAVRLFDASRAREREERLTTIGRLLSQVIHDFRSPMTVISGYVQLMEESDDPAQRRRYAEEILRQFEAVASMQREVLAFARGESDVFVRRVHVDRFFAELARQFRHELEGHDVDLELDVEPRLVARYDTERITRALLNLVRNAVEAMGDEGGRLVVGARREGSDLVLLVEDTGPGIPEAVRARLFQSFVTANKTGGTGLGLAIVKRIVEQHGGSVSVISGSGGTRFELRLPGQVEAVPSPKIIEPPVKAPAEARRPSKMDADSARASSRRVGKNPAKRSPRTGSRRAPPGRGT